MLSILTVLVLIEAGIGVCPSAHAAGPVTMTHDEPAMAHSAHAGDSRAAMEAREPCADDAAARSPDDETCCEGGAACGDCALHSVIFADPSGAPVTLSPELVRVFAPVTAPQPPITFEPPPPRSARA